MTVAVVVVGSGPAGASAARRLVEDGTDVVLLDAGDGPTRGIVVRAHGNTVFRWKDMSKYATDGFRSTGDPHTEYHHSDSFGGLSNYWTAAVPRFAPDDFYEGERLHSAHRWPIGYDDLAPYYGWCEALLTVTGGGHLGHVPLNTLAYRHEPRGRWKQLCDAAHAHGHGLGPLPMAKGHPWMIAMRGTEFNSYHCVLRDIESGGALRIRRRCRVTRLLWNASERRVHAVEYHDEAGVTHTIETRSVVLAAGAIESAKILLNSTSDTFPEGLGNEHDVLGRYLHDHPRQWWPMRIEPKVPAPHHPMYLTRASPESSLPLMATSATIGLRSPIDRLRTFVRGSTSMLGVQIFGTMVPSPEHGIRPNSDDPLHGPVDIAITYDEQARHNIDAARERVTEVFAAAGADVEPVAPFHELHPGSSIHFGGTVRMHDDPHYGMSDGTARLHAVRNVAVCDLSAFTTGPEKNPTLTSMAIAARAADHLAADLRDGTI